MEKIKLTLLVGGKTSEHQVNLISSKYVLPAINRDKYDLTLVGIDKQGTWYLLDPQNYLTNADDPKTIEFIHNHRPVFPVRKPTGLSFIDLDTGEVLGSTDVFFSLIGGTYAEDGRLQGLLDMLDVAYVGAGVTGSVLGMDKVVMKQVLRQSGILVTDFIGLKKHQLTPEIIKKAVTDLGFPVFVKPANLGSSVAVSKVSTEQELVDAINIAFEYDNKIILEKNITGREIECAVLGNNHDLIASIPGEVKSRNSFYDYNSKYIDTSGTELLLPAPLDEIQIKDARDLAARVFETLDCSCFGRVDMFFSEDGKWYANEINTIPGFTNNSMYPKLMELSGVKYTDLIDRLIALAFEKKADSDRLKL